RTRVGMLLDPIVVLVLGRDRKNGAGSLLQPGQPLVMRRIDPEELAAICCFCHRTGPFAKERDQTTKAGQRQASYIPASNRTIACPESQSCPSRASHPWTSPPSRRQRRDPRRSRRPFSACFWRSASAIC